MKKPNKNRLLSNEKRNTKDPLTIIKSIPMGDYMKEVKHKDPLRRIIRSHIYLDKTLTALIELEAIDPEFMLKMKPTFEEKIYICVGLGLNREAVEPLKAFNNMRNEFAHNLDYVIGKQEAKNLYKTLSSHQKEIYQRTIAQTEKRLPSLVYKELQASDQILLLSINLQVMILTAVKQGVEEKTNLDISISELINGDIPNANNP